MVILSPPCQSACPENGEGGLGGTASPLLKGVGGIKKQPPISEGCYLYFPFTLLLSPARDSFPRPLWRNQRLARQPL